MRSTYRKEANQGIDLSSHLFKMDQLCSEKMTPYMEIVGPWSNKLSAKKRAEIHLELLASTYGNGHPGSAGNVESVLNMQQSGQMLTWVVLWKNMPVGMVNYEVQDSGIAEAVRSVALPVGTKLANGEVYKGQANISAAMYKRMADLLRNKDASRNVWAIEGDVRLASTIKLPTGETLPSGVRTQHINALSGLKPFLLVVPRYRVHPSGGNPHQEVFLQSRMYTTDNSIVMNEPVFTPKKHPKGKTSIADIVKATYKFSGVDANIVDRATRKRSKPTISLENTAGIHFSTLRISGDVPAQTIKKQIEAGLKQSRFLEIIIPNRPENIAVQSTLMKMGVMPLGVFPGVKEFNSKNIETTIHFGIARKEIIKQMVQVECAKDYNGTEMEKLIYKLRNEWKAKE